MNQRLLSMLLLVTIVVVTAILVRCDVVHSRNDVVLDNTVSHHLNEKDPFPPSRSPAEPVDHWMQEQLELLWNRMNGEEHPPESRSEMPLTLEIVLHPNGKPTACGSIHLMQTNHNSNLNEGSTMNSAEYLDMDKFELEASLTEYVAVALNRPLSSCWSDRDEDHPETLLDYCDMGPDHTVVQRDYNQLVRVKDPRKITSTTDDSSEDDDSGTLPCRWYTREGVRIVSMSQLQTLISEKRSSHELERANCTASLTTAPDAEASIAPDGTTTQSPKDHAATCTTLQDPLTFDLYAVPAGRMFMFAPSHIGEMFTLDHIVLPPHLRDSDDRNTISLEVLSLEPRVFDIHHFFSAEESTQLMEKALAETSETYRFHRSTTGTSSSSIYNQRTSENAWDTHGATAQVVKRRCLQLLGFDEYIEEMTDGLQILRYNLTTAYTSHLDYLEDKQLVEPYDYDTSGRGGNRFATILLYFTSLGEKDGGETVFPLAWPPSVPVEDRLSDKDALNQLRNNADTKGVLKPGSWEENMAVSCRTRFSVRPQAMRAVLFYSQFPNGTLDPLSKHGGCPVVRGTKLAANLWTWSAIRPEFEGGPKRLGVVEDENAEESSDDMTAQSILATFRNRGTDERFRSAKLYYDEDGYFGDIGFKDDPIRVNTYSGHRWNVKDATSNVVLQTFVIADTNENQSFEV